VTDSDLRIDLAELHGLAAELAVITQAFDDARGVSDAVAQATGDDGLGARVRDFARTWQVKRQHMAESIQALHAHLESMTKGFTEVDAQLAAAVEGRGR